MANIPSPEEQRAQIKQIEKESITVGEQVCPISTIWYRNWKYYVKYDNFGSDITEVGPIDNSNIIKDGRLAPSMIENYNYYLIHKSSYDLLEQWYTGGPKLVIDVISNSRGKAVVPTSVLILKLNYKNTQEKDIETHKYVQFSEIHQKAKELFEVPPGETTRLIDFYGGIIGTEFDDQKYIENYPVISGEPILLDTQDETTKEWFSDSLRSKERKTKLYQLSSSSSSSSLDSPYNSPQKVAKSGNSSGTVGFSNLGNTCFFNSGTQCLMHTVPLVSKFVLSDEWEKDLNYTNKIGMKGELAKAFSSLAKKVWAGGYSSISPSNLKYVIGRFRDTFSGYDQQDSHELIYAMLDGIHEDLNRCKKKPVVDSVQGDGTDDEKTAEEAWKRYKLINDSIVVDIFDGLVRSRLICPECHSTTIVFDPFRSIPMPIAKPHVQKVKLTFVPFNFCEKRVVMKIEVAKSKNVVKMAAEQISKRIGRDVKIKIGSRTYSTYPLKWGVKNVTPSSTIYAYEIPENEKAIYMQCMIDMKTKYTVYSSKWNEITENIGIPFLVDVSDLPEEFDSDENLPLFQKKVEERLSELWPKDGENNDVQKDGKVVVESDLEKVKKDDEKASEEVRVKIDELADSNSEEKDNKEDVVNDDEKDSKKDSVKSEEITDAEKNEEKNNKEDVVNDDKKDNKEDEKGSEKEHVKSDEITDAEKNEEKDSKIANDDKKDNKEDDEKDSEKEHVKSDEITDAEKNEEKDKKKKETNELIEKFESKIDMKPPHGITFTDDSQKFSVTFKVQTYYSYGQVTPKEPIKTLSKESTHFVKARAVLNLNSKSNFSIENLIKNLPESQEKDSEKAKRSDQVSLDDCFKFFSLAEVLDEKNQWYCPKCKKFVCAEKKLDIWQTPKILIIQLKRFYGSGYATRKLGHYVDFPEFLDMKKYVIGPQKNENELKYRLYAVSNQYGSLGFGHYTAVARVRDPGAENDKGWYNFDDSYVSNCSESNAHTEAAYVLFYERVE